MGRMVGTELSNRLGQPVVIENIGGAGGAIGAQKVASAQPDGYTLLVGASNELAINKLVTKKVKYDIKDFTAIGLVASQPLVLVASPASGVKNAADFIQLVSKNPGKYSYGSSGVGTSLHLAGRDAQEPGQPVHDAHSLPRRGAAHQRPGGQQPGVWRVRALQRPAASSPARWWPLGTTEPNAHPSRPTFQPWLNRPSSRTWTLACGLP